MASLARLADSLFETGGSLSYALVGGYDSRQRPQLRLEVRGTLHLQCQRCLGLLEFPLRIDSTLLVLRADEQDSAAADDPLAPDAIDASPELDVASLIEDEILLSLPFAPKHAEGICRSKDDGTRPEARRASDFAAKLAAWKKV
jgi:uncharacterized protein